MIALGGAVEALDKAKRQGKTRFVGFTGHKDPAFHLHMLELGYAFDTVQMPLNPVDANYHSFEHQVLPEVNRRGMAALGIKSARGTAESVKKGFGESGGTASLRPEPASSLYEPMSGGSDFLGGLNPCLARIRSQSTCSR